MGALTNPNGQTYSPTWALEAKALLAAMSAYWIITIVAFTYRRRYWMAAGRQVQWTLLQAAGAWVSIAMHCIEIIQWYDHICWLQLWFNGISILIWCCAVGAQAVRLLFQYKVNKAKLFGAGKMANQSFNSRIVQHHPTPWEEEEKNPEPPSSHPSARTLLMQRLTRALSLSSWRSSATGLPTSTASSGGGDVKDSLTKGLQQDWYWTNRGRGTDRVLWKWVIGIVIVYVIHLFIIEAYTKTFTIWPTMGREISCKADWEYYSMYGMLVVFYLMVSPFILWRLQCVRDNNGVRNELLGVVAVTIPLNLVYFGWRYMPHKYYVAFHPQYWRILGLVIAHTISTVAPTIRSYRDVNMRQKTKLLHNMASFEQVLSDKSMWDAFKSHMAADFCVENALFYEAYQELMVVSAAAFARSNVFVRGMPQESALASSALRGTSSRVAPHTRRASGGNPNNATSCQSGINNPAAVTSMCAMTSTRRVNNPIGSRHSSGSGATATTSQNYTPELQSSCEVNSMKGDVVFPEFKDMSVPDAAKSLYTAFFEVYLTTGGSYEVNVPFHIRDEAQALVVADTMKVGMFARAKEEIVQNMFLNSFPSFLHRLRSDIPNSDALFGSISSPSSNLTARNSRTTRKPIPQATPAAAAVATTDWRSSVDEQEAGDYASEMEDVMGGGAV